MQCLECKSESVMCLAEEDEIKDLEEVPYMCEDCGHEQSNLDWRFRNYKIGEVLEVEEMKGG